MSLAFAIRKLLLNVVKKNVLIQMLYDANHILYVTASDEERK